MRSNLSRAMRLLRRIFDCARKASRSAQDAPRNDVVYYLRRHRHLQPLLRSILPHRAWRICFSTRTQFKKYRALGHRGRCHRRDLCAVGCRHLARLFARAARRPHIALDHQIFARRVWRSHIGFIVPRMAKDDRHRWICNFVCGRSQHTIQKFNLSTRRATRAVHRNLRRHDSTLDLQLVLLRLRRARRLSHRRRRLCKKFFARKGRSAPV